ncbi:adhesion G-protein coupled receptor G5-like isoform X1 [Anguilla anguilla]|uniref:adhesion G-protein coupled receptor G5-like isoform X1 n=1 Tax=Anguilla anguilla TaxID=7936 RepID=UPI0015AB36A7|nr:adhesion G-protein coupled receptor G5-like isoform X1 [Anguilla anguilla]XP_035273572.1 adhesion G-protein coupled receptor G5-like isoform X1 [Anguilla anguilla]XP_035273573.1 adhesion G-protein coupled receptor G5-like isoform X1 [Anguilla anguilla]XP_035273574.1 adhesion G-protein coupled receptor G5-like isoform X1 [Anguilla anguilla]
MNCHLHFLGLIVLFHTTSANCNPGTSKSLEIAFEQMEGLNENLPGKPYQESIRAIEKLEKVLESAEFSRNVSCTTGNLVVHLYNASGNFTGLNISANEMKASSAKGGVGNSSVDVHLPKTLLNPKENRTIVFCMITIPYMFEKQNFTVLYGRAVGLSVSNRTVTGLTDRINITFSLRDPSPLQEGKLPQCHFLNFSTNAYHRDGCLTIWKREEERLVCSCDHLTYFSVLLVNPETSERDRNILTYITLIGCSISLLFLVGTLFVYVRDRRMLADASPKVHLNLVVALIMLNIHFLPSQLIASLPVSGPCVYLAVMLHYSLLATFTWTAIEGFHLYLLLVRVFNIYVKRYLLKLGLVGWGVPAVVVAVILIIDRDIYQRVTLPSTDNSTSSAQICFLQDSAVRRFNLAFCGLVWACSLVMLALTCRLMLALRRDRMPGGRSRARKDVCAVLGIGCLLGITWGLAFFSFGPLPPTPALYLFCILNSLQEGGALDHRWDGTLLRNGRDARPLDSRSALFPPPALRFLRRPVDVRLQAEVRRRRPRRGLAGHQIHRLPEQAHAPAGPREPGRPGGPGGPRAGPRQKDRLDRSLNLRPKSPSLPHDNVHFSQ